MPDIAMCIGRDGGVMCPLRHTCYRYKATPSNWQSYLADAPWVGDRCKRYWRMEPAASEGKEMEDA